MNFYKPMLAKPISKPFSGKDWIFETKWDGFRVIASVKDNFTVQVEMEFYVAYTIVDEPLLPSDKHLTTNFVYFRWHGRGEQT